MTADRPILWHVPQSRSMRVLWLLHEIGCDFDMHELSFFDGSMRQPPYADLHPAGRVPAMQIDGAVLHESGAMIEYLCETRAPELWCAPGQPDRARWLDWLHYAETLGQHLANLTQHHIVLREDWMRSATVMRLEAARLARALALVTERVARHDWLMEQFSGVDCAIGYAVWLASRFTPLPPELAAYRDRCTARPAFQAALPPAGAALIYRKDFYEAPDA